MNITPRIRKVSKTAKFLSVVTAGGFLYLIRNALTGARHRELPSTQPSPSSFPDSGSLHLVNTSPSPANGNKISSSPSPPASTELLQQRNCTWKLNKVLLPVPCPKEYLVIRVRLDSNNPPDRELKKHIDKCIYLLDRLNPEKGHILLKAIQEDGPLDMRLPNLPKKIFKKYKSDKLSSEERELVEQFGSSWYRIQELLDVKQSQGQRQNGRAAVPSSKVVNKLNKHVEALLTP